MKKKSKVNSSKKKSSNNISSKKVIIYSTKVCPYCSMAKDFLKQNRISYKDVDVGSDYNAAQEMIKKSGQMGVPVIEINNKIIIGYDKDALKKALKIK